MTKNHIFIGDIHGNIEALEGMLHALGGSIKDDSVVFLGDYINKGSNSREVMECLISLARRPNVSILAGNHEREFRKALVLGDMAPFLKIGGAVTVKSYVGRPVGPDALTDLRKSVPEEHLKLLCEMGDEYKAPGLVARHVPHGNREIEYEVSAHRNVGTRPRITPRGAEIDTGCSDSSKGVLTAFFWPSKKYLQVDSSGTEIRN